MTLAELTVKLCSLNAPSGFEDAARECISEYLSPFVDETFTDPMGNLLAVRRCGRPDAKKLILDAHMDEIGFIITGYEKGFLRFGELGGVDQRMMPARRVLIMTDPPIVGVMDVMPPHVLSSGDMDASVPADKLYIDAGLSEEEAPKLVPLGTPAVFCGGCEELREGVICGKSLDDRACVAIVLKVFEELAATPLPFDLWALISTQEEMGMRGAAAGAFSIDAEYAVAIDVTHAETPDAKKGETMKPGGGAAISVGPNMNRAFTSAIRAAADRAGAKYQIEVTPGRSGTDAWPMQVARGGVATALLSLPIKYMHSPVELMQVSDAQSIVDILTAFLRETAKGGLDIC